MKPSHPSIVVTLTEDDIRDGVRRSQLWCPLALAARSAIANCLKVEVTDESLSVYYTDGNKETYAMSPTSRQFADFFDQGYCRTLLTESYDGEKFHLTRKENPK